MQRMGGRNACDQNIEGRAFWHRLWISRMDIEQRLRSMELNHIESVQILEAHSRSMCHSV